ncbi:MAG: serine hydrolase [Eubacteriales bacterium]|nr:serine hydrolase [Eubacteriales bacterium]
MKRTSSKKSPARTTRADSGAGTVPSKKAPGKRPAPNSARAARMRRRRRKKIFHTVLLLVLMAALAAGGGYAVYMIKDGPFAEPSDSYSAAKEFMNPQISGNAQRAEAFAAKLCVVEGDVSLDSVSLDSSQAGMLLDLNDMKVLYSSGAYNRVYPASITKIMTAMLALKYGNMDETVTISQENVTLEEGSQVCGFQAGDRVTMDQLLHCLLVYSGNDAASAIAEHVAGSTSAFVDMMNSYAAQLGCTGTHFTNPHGLQDENHYTTPYDIYLMLKEALKYPEFTEITQMPSYTVEYTRADGSQMATSLVATDHYLTGEANAPKDVSILGGKTGTTDNAGNCLALLSQNAYGKPFVSIVMGASTKELLYQQMNSLLENIN